MKPSRNILRAAIAATVVVVLCAFGAPARASGTLHPAGDYPGGMAPVSVTANQEAAADPAWLVRTGIKKGVFGRVLDEERFAGPDVAVLKSGFFGLWPALLAETREPSVLVEPWDIAGLSRTKPLLIIPTGGLSGLAGSDFFKAGLEEYVSSGGVVLCFAQQQGGDFSALPLPAGSKLEAAGWSQDAGPLFRASMVQEQHPLLAGVKRPVPSLETDGYFVTAPPAAKVLFARPDGLPTMLLYPLGKGWVIVTTLFPEVSHGRKSLHPDEGALVRDLLMWAKFHNALDKAVPGEHARTHVTLRGPEQGEASSARIMVVKPGSDKPVFEQVVKAPVKSGQEITVPVNFALPLHAHSGIYRMDYVLLNAAGKPIAPAAESASGSVFLGQAPAGAAVPRAAQPMPAVTLPLTVRPAIEAVAERIKVTLEITAEAGAAAQNLLVRVGGQEKFIRLSQPKTDLSFDLPAREAGDGLFYGVYHAGGRVLAQGLVPVLPPAAPGVRFDRVAYQPGQIAKASISGLGSGELTLLGLGQIENKVVKDGGTMDFPVPALLAPNAYPVEWELMNIDGTVKKGTTPLTVTGSAVKFLGLSLERKQNKVSARFRVHAGRSLQGTLQLMLRRPDGSVRPAADQPVTLADGAQEIPASFSFKPDQAGIWELRSQITSTLPPAVGIPDGPMVLASARTLFDVGTAAVLGIRTDRPVFYEPAGGVEVSAYLFGTGKGALDVSADGKSVKEEKRELKGLQTASVPLSGLAMGSHTVTAVFEADGLESVRERSFTYGANLPDLAISITMPEPKGVLLPVGLVVRNQGKNASGTTRVALYEGSPASGRKPVGTAEVPALAPGTEALLRIDWPLTGKAGARTLAAVVDPDHALVELNKNNNTASADITVPDVLLSVTPGKASLSADEDIAFTVLAANLTDHALTAGMQVQIIDAKGAAALTETLSFPGLPAGGEKQLEQSVRLTMPATGSYRLQVRIGGDKPLASAAAPLTVLPTLLIQGSLEGTPRTAGTCRPFTATYSVRNAGNIPVTGSAVSVEIQGAGLTTPLSATVPWSEKPEPAKLPPLHLPQGTYSVLLKATATNQQYGIKKELILAEQPLTVTGPVQVKKSSTLFPRVLVLRGHGASLVDQAIVENILKLSFEQQPLYYKIVDREEDFQNQSLTGLFNTYVLFETDEMTGNLALLMEEVNRGSGLVIVGESSRARAAAEAFGFQFGDPLPAENRVLSVPEGSVLSVCGTIPISGRLLPPRKKGAHPAAFLAGTKQAAILTDGKGKSKLVLIPFSLVVSARDTGAGSICSVLLRSAVTVAAPESEEAGNAAGGEFVVSSETGPVKARIVETLPPGAKLIWSSPEASAKNGVMTYEITADSAPQSILTLFEPADQGQRNTTTEVFFECDGTFVSQGKVE